MIKWALGPWESEAAHVFICIYNIYIYVCVFVWFHIHGHIYSSMVFTHIATSIYSCKGETGVAARDALAVFRLAPSGKRTLKFCTKRTHMKHPCWHFFGERSWTLFMLTSNKTARLWHFRGIWDPELGAFSALLFNQPCFFPLSSAGRKLPLRGWLFYQRFSSVLGPSCDDLTRNPSYRNFDLGLCCVQIAMSKCSPRSNHQMKQIQKTH
jgi:hypothetical protein